MPNKTLNQEHELRHRVRADVLPHPEADLDANVAHIDRRRSTSNESQASHDGGLVVMLWLLALLIAEIEFRMLAFAHMYRM